MLRLFTALLGLSVATSQTTGDTTANGIKCCDRSLGECSPGLPMCSDIKGTASSTPTAAATYFPLPQITYTTSGSSSTSNPSMIFGRITLPAVNINFANSDYTAHYILLRALSCGMGISTTQPIVFTQDYNYPATLILLNNTEWNDAARPVVTACSAPAPSLSPTTTSSRTPLPSLYAQMGSRSVTPSITVRIVPSMSSKLSASASNSATPTMTLRMGDIPSMSPTMTARIVHEKPSETSTMTPRIADIPSMSATMTPRQVEKPSETSTTTPRIVEKPSETSTMTVRIVEKPSETSTMTSRIVQEKPSESSTMTVRIADIPSMSSTMTPRIVQEKPSESSTMTARIADIPSMSSTMTPRIVQEKPSESSTMTARIVQEKPSDSSTMTARIADIPSMSSTMTPRIIEKPSETSTMTARIVQEKPSESSTMTDRIVQEKPSESSTITARIADIPSMSSTMTARIVEKPSETSTMTGRIVEKPSETSTMTARQVERPSATSRIIERPSRTATPKYSRRPLFVTYTSLPSKYPQPSKYIQLKPSKVPVRSYQKPSITNIIKPPIIITSVVLQNANTSVLIQPDKLQQLQASLACALQTPLENIQIINITYIDSQGTHTYIRYDKSIPRLSSNGSVACYVQSNSTIPTSRRLSRNLETTEQTVIDYAIIDPSIDIVAMNPSIFTESVIGSGPIQDLAQQLGSTGLSVIVPNELLPEDSVVALEQQQQVPVNTPIEESSDNKIGIYVGSFLAVGGVAALVAAIIMNKRKVKAGKSLTSRVEVIEVNPITRNKLSETLSARAIYLPNQTRSMHDQV
jgi:hypothetical protein